MSGLFGDEDSAAEKLLRAGIATDRTIFTAPANRTGETDQIRRTLLHPPRSHDPRVNDGPPPPPPPLTFKDRFPTPDEMVYPTVSTPTEVIDDRFPKRLDMMRNVEPAPGELSTETLKRELLKMQREERRRRRRN